MFRKRERLAEDRLGHPYDVPAEEFIAVPEAGEFPEWLPGMHEDKMHGHESKPGSSSEG